MSSSEIKKIRKTLKLTQAAAAALVQVSPNTWARWERGEAKPRGLHQHNAISKLSLSVRRRRPRRAKTNPSSPVPPNWHKMPRSTGATLLEFLAAEKRGGGNSHKRKARRNLIRSHSTTPVQKRKLSTGADWLKFAGTWVGNDAEELLKEVYALRTETEF